MLLMYVVCAGAKFFSLKPNMILAQRSGGKGKKKERGRRRRRRLLKHLQLL